MYACQSGRHHWRSQEDATKCCNDDYVRVLCFGGGDATQNCEGILIGREWIRKHKNNPSSTGNGYSEVMSATTVSED